MYQNNQPIILLPNIYKSLRLVLSIKSHEPEKVCLIFKKEGTPPES